MKTNTYKWLGTWRDQRHQNKCGNFEKHYGISKWCFAGLLLAYRS